MLVLPVDKRRLPFWFVDLGALPVDVRDCTSRNVSILASVTTISTDSVASSGQVRSPFEAWTDDCRGGNKPNVYADIYTDRLWAQ